MPIKNTSLSFILCLSCAAILSFATIPTASAYWEDHRSTKSQVKKLKKNKQIPTSMSCKNAPDAGSRLKPVVTIKSAPNKDERAWVLMAYYDNLVWQPESPGGKSQFSKKYSKRISAKNSGRDFHCSLWIGPKGSLKTIKRVGRWARSKSGGVLSVR